MTYIVFGLAFAALLAIALKRHDIVERAARVEAAARAH
jgi:hypothetical protein